MSDPVTKFLTVDDALEVTRLVTGEPARVRDFADLHAALARPQQTEDGRELFPGVWDKAAALMESLGPQLRAGGWEQAAHLERDVVLPRRERSPAG
jgi:hypothetical protein